MTNYHVPFSFIFILAILDSIWIYSKDAVEIHTCCCACCKAATDGFVSKCWRWCNIRWFFWKNALPHSQTCVRNVHPPFGWRRLCCRSPCLAANPLPQLWQKCVFGFCCGVATTTLCWLLCCWTSWTCCCCCWFCQRNNKKILIIIM